MPKIRRNGDIKQAQNKGDVITVDTTRISAYLKELRQKNNLTQQNVADKLGLTPQAVSKWERCESMPDITLLPELAKIYGITVENILAAGSAEQSIDFDSIMQALNTFVDERIFEKILQEFKNAKNAQDISIPMDIFMALNGNRKDSLLGLLLEKEDYWVVVDDILQYLNTTQRTRLIRHAAEDGDYQVLETLIPYMTRSVRTEVVTLLLERGKLDFIEEMLLFLTREQKDIIIRYCSDNGLDIELPENFRLVQ